ncbi:MIP/aquaporin family protein [Solitalea canadensis]|uniref:MIP family channel protein n=1 Tax=Solitalea canadensis (strain ATCC 29591 / DSM 3403 / JCM 21819 / LMG 8368 / NBRC 15130 / NCIMB 12057 / USAM 9D) TaxID=929556 RepID=H8KRL9_SOLCM|nr:MIP/aquaporin family protein [Solitalea canadensis]AFD07600.1 MIP family channel protein [Solitalea canadensis DSM 3403]
MTAYLYEFIGTAILILLGNGVVANVLLAKSKGQNGGWIVITFGWAIAVFVAVIVSSKNSGAHLNPAVSIGLAMAGKFSWQLVPAYVLAQISGAFAGAVLVWLTYKKHYDETTEAGLIEATFCTAPAIPHTINNLFTEIVGTFVLIFTILYLASPQVGIGSVDALPVSLVVLGIGLSLGGPTGYAINPARDFGPRLAHAFLPINHKGMNNWNYCWIPIIGPIIGSILAALVFKGL